MQESKLPEGTYARFETSEGTFTARLFADKVPQTTQNFIDLAEGKKAHLDPQTRQMVKTPMFNERKIYRIIKGFMFQTGAANDSCRYNSGFSIPDEFDPSLKHSKAGILSMANAGPNTGSTQFFVTFGATPGLNNKHAVFGEVVEGMDTIRKIEQTPVQASENDEMSEPIKPPVIHKVTIVRMGK
jgi:peptidyl-prolyl cis-trans isomerase A (cyclophilin A)